MSSIDIVNLSQQFKGHLAVDNVSLSIADGDFVVLLGPSGCGKTTLLRMIAGLLEPTAGQILIDGVDVTALPSKRRNLAMVFQSYALYPHLSVAKNIEFPLVTAKMTKIERTERVRAVATMLGLEHLLTRRPRELSGGQRQRVAVARALARRPGAYLMDEPLSNLDAKLRTATRKELTDLHDSLESTFIYVTHDQIEAMTMATKIVILNNGRIEQVGSPADVYDHPASVFVAGFIGSPAMNLVPAQVSSTHDRVTVRAQGIDGSLWSGSQDELDVVVGVRPEHLRIEQAGPQALQFTGFVERVENLGHQQLVHLTVGDSPITSAIDRLVPIERGILLTLHAHRDDVHLFDATSGRRMEWVTDPDVLPTPSEPLLA